MNFNSQKPICYKCLKSPKAAELPYHGLHPACFQAWFGTTLEFESLMLKPNPPEALARNLDHSSFFQGKYKKYSARLKQENYIFKVQEKEYPALPTSEYLCNQLAEALDLEIPPYYLIRFQNTLETFVVKNFMDKLEGNLVHLYRYFKEQESEFNCAKIIEILEQQMGSLKNIHRFIDICLFDALIGNHDRHGRNLGLIQTKEGCVLSPFYDNASYLCSEDEALLVADHERTGRIGTLNQHNPGMTDYIQEFKRLGFEERILKFHKKIKMQTLLSLINSAFITTQRKMAFERLISKRYREMCDALSNTA